MPKAAPGRVARRRYGTGSVRQMPNGRWRAIWRRTDGTRDSQRFETQKDAERWIIEKQHARASARRDLLGAPSFEEAVRQYLDFKREQGRIKPGTLTGYDQKLRVISHYPEWKRPVDKIGSLAWDRLFGQEAKRTSPENAAHVRATVRQLYRFARRSRWVAENPITETDPRPHRRREYVILTPQQVMEYLGAVRHIDPFYVLFFALAFFYAMRPGELRGLRWSSIDLKARRIYIREQAQSRGLSTTAFVEPKWGSRRRIPLGPYVIQLIKEHREIWEAKRSSAPDRWGKHADLDLVFPNPVTGWFITDTKVRDDVHVPACHLTGLRPSQRGQDREDPGLRIYDSRHTAITHMLLADISERVIMMVAGHTSRRMYERYTHARDAMLDQAAVLQEQVYRDLDRPQDQELLEVTADIDRSSDAIKLRATGRLDDEEA